MSLSVYPNFCPVAMASDLLEPRWTMLVLSEMWAGATRFSQIQGGVPGMSPALLSKRLKEMEKKGLVQRRSQGALGHAEYLTTPMADELQPIVRALGEWAHRNVECEISLRYLDARVLMWNIRRKIRAVEIPLKKCVVQFTLNDPDAKPANYWLIIKPGFEPDLCFSDPAFNVDLYIISELRALTSAWMGHSRFEDEIKAERIVLVGHDLLARSLTRWLVPSSYAHIKSATPMSDQTTEQPTPRRNRRDAYSATRQTAV